MTSKRVTVLMGGFSAEREVSLSSGYACAVALEKAGYGVVTIDVRRELRTFVDGIIASKADVVFNALHGRGGEDGCLQGVLEILGIPYSHSGVMASAVAMDKDMTKQVVATAGVRSPQGLLIGRGGYTGGHPMPPPYVVKPVDEGSTVGLTMVKAGDAPVSEAVLEAIWAKGSRVLVEAYIPGRELTVGVMGDRPLAVTEILFDGSIFDYTAKYTAGHARHVVPADLPSDITQELKRLALAVHQTLGCRGVSRSDFRYDDSKPGTEGLYFLEVNTQPGMTPLSLVPEQAAHLGISYQDLVSWIVEAAAWQG